MRKKRSTRPGPRPGTTAVSMASNFRLPVMVMRAGSAPSCGQAARGLLALDAEAIDVGEHAPEERPDQPVARERAVRDAAVDDHRLDAAAAAFAQQVRPDLVLDHHEQPRPHHRQRAPDGERPVEREVEDAVDVHVAAPGQLLARQRGRREEQPQRGITAAQLGDQRPRREHLADRDGVHPDRLLGVEIERHGKIAEPLPQAADVLVVAQRLIQEIRRQRDEREQRDNAVEEIHAKPQEM